MRLAYLMLMLLPQVSAFAYHRLSLAPILRRRLRGRLHASASTDAPASPHGVVFLGTPDVAALSLKQLLEASRDGLGGGFSVSLVVTQPPARSGRSKGSKPSPVQVLAESEGIQVVTPEKARDPLFLDQLTALAPDLCITAAYGQFLPQKFLDIPKYGTLNIHPSLLPKYRGASPVQRALEAGDELTGVTVLFTALKMDSGPILEQVPYRLKGHEKTPELLATLFRIGTDSLVTALPKVWSRTATLVPQAEDEATAAAKLSADDAECAFDDIPKGHMSCAETIHNKVRGFQPWPGVWVTLAWETAEGLVNARIKLLTTEIYSQDNNIAKDQLEGTQDKYLIVSRGKDLEIKCADASVLRVLEMQPVGKKPMDAKAFLNGLRDAKATLRWVPSTKVS